jgi:hypothetical protein
MELTTVQAATAPGSQPGSVPSDRAAGGPGAPGGSRPGPPRPSGRAVLAGLASLSINFVLPLGAYYLIHPHVRSSALALALAGAIPVAYTLAILVARRKLSPLGVVSVISFGIGVLISWASGGSAVALELQDPELTGLIGIACLASVAVGHPLHPIILRMLGRGNARYSDIANRVKHKTSMITTAILGLTLSAHAAAITILALTQTTSTFVALQHVVGLPPVAVGLASAYFYVTRQQARQRAAASAPADTTRADGDETDGAA